MLEQHPSLYVVLISLLSVAMFNYLHAKQNIEIGIVHRTPLINIIEIFIYVGVIYITFSELKWWIAMIDLCMSYFVIRLLVRNVCEIFVPDNFNEVFTQARIEHQIQTATKANDIIRLRESKNEKRNNKIGIYLLNGSVILLIISVVLVGIKLFS